MKQILELGLAIELHLGPYRPNGPRESASTPDTRRGLANGKRYTGPLQRRFFGAQPFRLKEPSTVAKHDTFKENPHGK